MRKMPYDGSFAHSFPPSYSRKQSSSRQPSETGFNPDIIVTSAYENAANSKITPGAKLADPQASGATDTSAEMGLPIQGYMTHDGKRESAWIELKEGNASN